MHAQVISKTVDVIISIHVVVLQTMARTCSKVRVARAARLFFLTRPNKFSIFGIVVTFPVVDAKTP